METKPELTSIERGKLMNLYWTQRNKEVVACGHKLNEYSEPKNNCADCWVAFFQTHGELTQAVEECFQKEGKEGLTTLKGKKFVKYFLLFMGTLATSLKGANE